MDLHKIIQELHEEREILDEAIRVLETMDAVKSDGSGRQASKRRGGNGMSQAQRLAISRRMKKYWRARRKKQIAN